MKVFTVIFVKTIVIAMTLRIAYISGAFTFAPI
jgi:hypothetical protein